MDLSTLSVIFAIIAIIAVAIVGIYRFFALPTPAQLEKVKQWLIFATANAEAELGAGQGKMKLRLVFDQFVQRFPAVANLITFEQFSMLVDEALTELKNMLKDNKKLQEYVGTDKM